MCQLGIRFATTVTAIALLQALSPAQTYVFQVNQGQSNFTWTGSVTIPTYSPNPLPIVGNPSNTFQLQGTVDVDLPSGLNPISTGLYSGGDSLVIPDIHGKVNNPINPNLPPIGTIDITGLHVAFISNQDFPVGSNGSFTMTFPVGYALSALAGTITYNVSGFVPGGGPIAPNITSDVQGSGTLTRNQNVLHVNMPVSAISFPFFYSLQPSGGGPPVQVLGQITMNGVLDATDTIPPVGTPGCFPGTGGVIACPCGQPANPAGGCANFGAGSTTGGVLGAIGNASVGSDTLLLTTSNHRSPASGVLNVFFSYKPGSATPTTGTVSGAGVRCYGSGGSLKRLYTVQVFGGTASKPGTGDLSISGQSAALTGHAIAPPETRHYFNVYRDGQATGPCGSSAISTNLTNMDSITWAP